MVYELPVKPIEKSIDTLYLRKVGVPMVKKWPMLAHSKHFQVVKDIMDVSFIFRNSTSDYIYFMTNLNRVVDRGMFFDLKTEQVYNNMYTTLLDPFVFIEHENKNFLYIIRKVQDNLQIAKCNAGGTIYEVTSYRNICLGKGKRIKFTTDNCKTKLPLMLGFVKNHKFYLFGNDKVITFNEKALDKPDTWSNFHIIHYGNYSDCKWHYEREEYHYLSKGVPLCLKFVLNFPFWFQCMSRISF